MKSPPLQTVSWALALCAGCSSPAASDPVTLDASPPDASTVDASGPVDARIPDHRPRPIGPLKIASFNIQVFGPAKAARPAVLDELVRVIRGYHLVAVQEIVDATEAAPNRLLQAINEAPGPRYAMSLSPRTGLQPDDTTFREQYAFFYDTQAVGPLGPGVLFDDRAADLFQREPYVARFAAGELTFVLINIHTQPERAVAELDGLERVFAWAKKLHDDEERFIALGDFNAGCAYASAEALDALAISGPDYRWIVPHEADTNLADSRCAYDRILINESTTPAWTGQWGVDRSFDDTGVSDHWPVWATFRTTADAESATGDGG